MVLFPRARLAVDDIGKGRMVDIMYDGRDSEDRMFQMRHVRGREGVWGMMFNAVKKSTRTNCSVIVRCLRTDSSYDCPVLGYSQRA